jgi:hypothetical protein
MKKKGNRMVPNCVPKNEEAELDEGLQQTLRKVVPGHAKREIDKKMDAGKFGKTDADKDANFQRYKKIQDKLKKEELELDEGEGGSESWEAGYKRRVVKTTSAEHKEKGHNWRIKGKERPEISIKLYKEKPSQAEFNKQMRRVAGHEFGG